MSDLAALILGLVGVLVGYGLGLAVGKATCRHYEERRKEMGL